MTIIRPPRTDPMNVPPAKDNTKVTASNPDPGPSAAGKPSTGKTKRTAAVSKRKRARSVGAEEPLCPSGESLTKRQRRGGSGKKRGYEDPVGFPDCTKRLKSSRSATPEPSDAAKAATADEAAASPRAGARPDGFEGPLCPSGDFFSKLKPPQQEKKRRNERDQMETAPAVKRAKLSPPSQPRCKHKRQAEEHGPTFALRVAKRLKLVRIGSAGEESFAEMGSAGEGQCRGASPGVGLEEAGNGSGDWGEEKSEDGEQDVGYVKYSTVVRAAKALANLRRRWSNAPMVWNELEKEFLHVLEGSLVYDQHAETLEQILRGKGSRIIEKLKQAEEEEDGFFVSQSTGFPCPGSMLLRRD